MPMTKLEASSKMVHGHIPASCKILQLDINKFSAQNVDYGTTRGCPQVKQSPNLRVPTLKMGRVRALHVGPAGFAQ